MTVDSATPPTFDTREALPFELLGIETGAGTNVREGRYALFETH